MQRLTLILPIADKEMGNRIAAIVGSNPGNMTTFDNSLLTYVAYPLDVTHCWMSTGVTDEEKTSLSMSLELFPDAIFVFHTNDELMQVIASNNPTLMAFQGQPLSPMQALELLELTPFSTGVTP